VNLRVLRIFVVEAAKVALQEKTMESQVLRPSTLPVFPSLPAGSGYRSISRHPSHSRVVDFWRYCRGLTPQAFLNKRLK
jgi:hypothetical protein